MPINNEQKDVKKNKKINSVTASLPALVKALGTDAVNGLSPKEVNARLLRIPQSLYASGTFSLRECLSCVCREPVLWLFLICSIVAIFFGRITIGLICTGITVKYAFTTFLMFYKSEETDANMNVYDQSLCRVIRAGRQYCVQSDGVVVGDIIIFQPGDIISVDARLITASPNFTVTERELESKENLRHTVRLLKHANAQMDSPIRLLHSPDNMVFAGGTVESGSARALVVAVGQHTRLGGLSGAVLPSHKKRNSSSSFQLRKILKYTTLFLLVSVIPLTVIGIVTLSKSYDLLDIVLSSLSLSVLVLPTPLIIRENWIGAKIRHLAAMERDTENTADIRSNVILDKLSALDEIVLVGTSGIHDGGSHPDTLYIGKSVYDCTHLGEGVISDRILEGMAACQTGLQKSNDVQQELSLTVTRLFSECCERSSFDIDDLLTRTDLIKVRNRKESNDGEIFIDVVMKDGLEKTYAVLNRWQDITSCDSIFNGTQVVKADQETFSFLFSETRKAYYTGLHTAFLISAVNNQLCLECMLTYTPHVCRKINGVIRQMEENHIRVTAFLRTVSAENTHILSECGLTANFPANRPDERGQRDTAAVLCDKGIRAFEGCTTSYILDYIKTRQTDGHHVGVLSGDATDFPILTAADVSFTTSPALYKQRHEGLINYFIGHAIEEYGMPNSLVANDSCRRKADVTVRRTTENGGGLQGIRKTLITARHYRHTLYSIRRYVLCSQIVRAFTLLIPLCLGLGLIPSFILLASGMIADVTVAMLIAFRKCPTEMELSTEVPAFIDKMPQNHDLKNFPRIFLPECIASLSSCVITWLAVVVASLIGYQFGNTLWYFGLLTLSMTQIAVSITDRCMNVKIKYGFPVSLLSLCVYVGCLAAALIGGLPLLWCLLFPLISCIVFIVTLQLCKKFLIKNSK